jgi:hypothetical protein
MKIYMAELYITLEFAKNYSPRRLLSEDCSFDMKIRINNTGEIEFSPNESHSKARNKNASLPSLPAVQISLGKEPLTKAMNARKRRADELKFGILHDVFFQITLQLGCLRERVFSTDFQHKIAQNTNEIALLWYEFELRFPNNEDLSKLVH